MSESGEAIISEDLIHLLNTFRDGVFLLMSGELVAANRQLSVILEVPSKGLTLKALYDRLNRTDNATARGNLKRLFTGKPFGPIQITLPIEGEPKARTVELTCNNLKFGGQQFLQGTVVDLTREFAIETELFETLSLLNSIFDAIDEAIFILDKPDLTLRSSNVAVSRIFKIDRSTLKGKTLWTLLADSQNSEFIIRQIRDKLPDLGSIHFDLDMRRGDGSTFPSLNTITGVKDSRGVEVAYMWIVSDMSQQSYLNCALSEIETRYRLLFDRAADATFIIDADSNKIIDANHAAEIQLNRSRAEIIGLDMFDITPPERHRGLKNDLERLLTDGSLTLMGVNITEDGRRIPVEITSVVTTFGKRRVYMMACRDMTQQLDRQRERLHLEKLEAVRQVTGGIAHEFSQPLQGLMTIADIIESGADKTPQAAELIRRIPPMVERMTVLLNQMQRIVRLATRPYTNSDAILDFGQSVRLPRMMIVGFEQESSEIAAQVAKARGYEPIVVGDANLAKTILVDIQPELVIADTTRRHKSTDDFLKSIRRRSAQAAVVEIVRSEPDQAIRESDLIARLDEFERGIPA